jgi:catechol 2,3-dioxygenase-like lactoylglutathione lyase family enzyme
LKQHISSIALVVADYDEAIDWYTRVLGFVVVEDTVQSADKRWVLLSPPGARETRLLLAKASNPRQHERVGDQAGGRVFLLLQTDDFWRDYRRMQAQGATFCEEPREEAYGTVVVFEDLYGNRWDLLQLK